MSEEYEEPREEERGEEEGVEGIPPIERRVLEYLTEPGLPLTVRLTRVRLVLNRELRTGNITSHEAAMISEDIAYARDCLILGLEERAENVYEDILAELGLSKSKYGWLQRMQRTVYRGTLPVEVGEVTEKRSRWRLFGGER